jgi:hypothetical protein
MCAVDQVLDGKHWVIYNNSVAFIAHLSSFNVNQIKW